MSRKNTTTEIINRKGISKNIKINDIKVESTHRLGNEIQDGKAEKKFKALERSIKANGILNPILVKKNEDETYTIIDGKRRFAAAQRLGYKRIQVVFYKDIENPNELLSLVANTNQKALTPIELGFAYKRLIDSGAFQTNRELAKALGVSESTVGSKIKNLELDKRIIEKLMEDNSITDQKVLKALRNVESVDADGISNKQFEIFESIVTQGLNRKEALELIKLGREVQEALEDTHTFLTEVIEEKLEIKVSTDGLDENSINEIKELIERIKEVQQGTHAVSAA